MLNGDKCGSLCYFLYTNDARGGVSLSYFLSLLLRKNIITIMMMMIIIIISTIYLIILKTCLFSFFAEISLSAFSCCEREGRVKRSTG